MQPEETETLAELLSRVIKELSSKGLFDSTIVLAIIDFFEQEKITQKEILNCLETSFGGGFIEKLKQINLNAYPKERIRADLSKAFFPTKSLNT